MPLSPAVVRMSSRDETRSHFAIRDWMVFSLDVSPAREDGWNRDAIVRGFLDSHDAEPNRMIAVGRDAVDVFEEEVSQPPYLGKASPSPGFEPSHQGIEDARSGLGDP